MGWLARQFMHFKLSLISAYSKLGCSLVVNKQLTRLVVFFCARRQPKIENVIGFLTTLVGKKSCLVSVLKVLKLLFGESYPFPTWFYSVLSVFFDERWSLSRASADLFRSLGNFSNFSNFSNVIKVFSLDNLNQILLVNVKCYLIVFLKKTEVNSIAEKKVVDDCRSLGPLRFRQGPRARS